MMSVPLRSAACLLFLLATTLLPACTTEGPTAGPVPATVRVVDVPFLSYAPFHIAAEEGYFAEQNLEVDFVKLSRNSEAIAALARGEVDVGSGLLTAGIVNAILGGARLRIVADKGYLPADGCTVNAAVARRALVEAGELDRPEQLRGRRVDLNVVLPEAYWFDRLLQTAGLTLDDLEIVNIPPPADVEALTHGTIDVTVATEPDVTRLLSSGEAVVWRPAEQVIPGFQWAGVFYGSSLLDERPEVGRRFMVAYLKAVHQYNQGKTPRNVEILSHYTNLNETLLQEACWPSLRDDGQVDPAGLLQFEEWALSRQLLDGIVPAEQLVDRRFVEAAARASSS